MLRDIEVSEVGMGCMAFSHGYGKIPEDEMANIAELLMSDAGAFITGSTFLADGGATASYYYGPLQPDK
jgi:hypothetical protein